MKHVILLLISFLPVLLYAQYPANPNKIRLGFQTTGNGLIYRAGSAPTQFPTGYNSPFQQYDTVANVLWVYQDSFWYATNTVRRSTPPPYSSTASGLTLVYGHATWQDSDDEQRYEYVANDSIEAWVPAVGIHYAISAPADIAATGSTGAVEYTAALWNKTPTDSLFRHDGSNWVFIGKSGPHFVRGDSGALQSVAEGDTLTLVGLFGIDIVTASGDTVTVMVDTTQIATQSDLGAISTSFVVDADTGTPQTIASGDTLQINSGWGANTTVGATGVVTVTGDSSQVATQYDIVALHTGPLTAGRIPRATGTYTLSDGVLRDDGTLLALGGVTVAGYSFYDYSTGGWRLATGTTAQRPTNVAGVFRHNTTLGYPETGDGSNWLQSAFPVGTTSYTLRYNGTSWVANSFLLNTGSAIGINIAAPGAQLDIAGWLRLGGDGNNGASIGIGQRNSNVAGAGNVALGDENLTNRASTGNYNIGIGRRAGYGITTGDENINIGSNAGRYLSTGSSNVIIGAEAGMQFLAGRGLLTGSSNFLLGYRAAYDIIQSGVTQGIFLGNESGAYASVGTSCIFIGYRAGKDNNVANVIAIGNRSLPTAANQILIGDANGSYTQLKSRNYAFNIDQTVGAGQDGYALKYNNGTGEIELAADATGGTMSSFTLAGSSGTPQTISDGNTATIEAGYGMTTTAAATDKVTVAADTTKLATLYDVTSVGNTLYTGDGTIETDRTVTIDDNYALIISGSPGVLSFTETSGYIGSLSSYGFYKEIADTAYYITQATIKQPGGAGSTLFQVVAGRQDASTMATAEVNGDGGASLSSLNVSGESSLLLNGGSATYAADVSHITKIGATTIHTTTSTGIGINDTSPEKSLDVGGMGKFRQLSGQDNSVTIGTNANAGTGRSASITDSQSSDVAGRFSFTSGTGLTAGEWVTLTWGTAFDNAPAVVLMPEDANGASITPYLFVQPSTTGCSIQVNVTGVPYEGLTFSFNYIVIQGK
jgi:hypothetical protein